MELVNFNMVEEVHILGSLLKNKNFVHEEIKHGLKAGNSRNYSVQIL